MKTLEIAKLSDIEEKHYDLLLHWRNKERIRNVMFESEIISELEHEKWCKKQKKSATSIHKIFVINNTPVGVLNITNINNERNRGEWGFYIGIEESPKGLGKLLGYTSLNYIFNDLQFKKISAQVLGSNKISINYHAKLGFVQEGKLRKNIEKAGVEEDIYIFGIFKHEWTEKAAEIKNEIEGMKL